MSQPLPTSFRALNLHPDFLASIEAAGFTAPTPVQAKAIPPGMAGRDVLACAMTGSGKTAAFLLPLFERLRTLPRGKTRALVLTPTRELAAQIVEHGEALTGNSRIRLAPIYGGVGISPQLQAFKSGVDIMVACPGRLLDILDRPGMRLPDLEILVLDEADRMLDMGFLPDVKKVLARIPKPKQTLFFSATLPPQIVDLSQNLLKNPVMIDVERQVAPSTQVEQAAYPVPEASKRHLLLELLRRGKLDQVLVFTRTKHRADRLADFLKKHGVEADRIHANRSQNQRTKALADFKDGVCQVLVATDIAARGIDVEALPHVVNYDVPNVPEDYVHRIGRTGRAAATGDAFTFVSPAEEGFLRAIERVVGQRIDRLKLEGFDPAVQRIDEPLEVPLHVRLAAMRAARGPKKTTATNAARPAAARPAGGPSAGGRPGARPAAPGRPSARPDSRDGRGNHEVRHRDDRREAPHRDDRRGAPARPPAARPAAARPASPAVESGQRQDGYRGDVLRTTSTRSAGGYQGDRPRTVAARPEGQQPESPRPAAGQPGERPTVRPNALRPNRPGGLGGRARRRPF